jgi:hypothetical protein
MPIGLMGVLGDARALTMVECLMIYDVGELGSEVRRHREGCVEFLGVLALLFVAVMH